MRKLDFVKILSLIVIMSLLLSVASCSKDNSKRRHKKDREDETAKTAFSSESENDDEGEDSELIGSEGGRENSERSSSVNPNSSIDLSSIPFEIDPSDSPFQINWINPDGTPVLSIGRIPSYYSPCPYITISFFGSDPSRVMTGIYAIVEWDGGTYETDFFDGDAYYYTTIDITPDMLGIDSESMPVGEYRATLYDRDGNFLNAINCEVVDYIQTDSEYWFVWWIDNDGMTSLCINKCNDVYYYDLESLSVIWMNSPDDWEKISYDIKYEGEVVYTAESGYPQASYGEPEGAELVNGLLPSGEYIVTFYNDGEYAFETNGFVNVGEGTHYSRYNVDNAYVDFRLDGEITDITFDNGSDDGKYTYSNSIGVDVTIDNGEEDYDILYYTIIYTSDSDFSMMISSGISSLRDRIDSSYSEVVYQGAAVNNDGTFTFTYDTGNPDEKLKDGKYTIYVHDTPTFSEEFNVFSIHTDVENRLDFIS